MNMITNPKLLILCILNSTCCQSLFAQGGLTPPGAPAPTMKSLDQIEPRTPVSSAPYTITNPGSYYLTSNLTVSSGDAITIAASGVTLDLGGFTIGSTAAPATGHGIKLNSALRNIIISNGFIEGGVTNNAGTYSGNGFAYGIFHSGSAPANVLVSRVSVAGCLNHGVYLGTDDSTIVESCMVRTVGGYGIRASIVKLSSAIDCGGAAIYGDAVSDSRGQASGSSWGVFARTAQNCIGSSSSGTGISATTATGCYGLSTSGFAIVATIGTSCRGTPSSITHSLNCF